MIIKSAEFVISNTNVSLCPEPDRPEYAFIGRSNVGKSSLINMLANNKKLAKTSATPGKTQLINHFNINDEWYLVDLPGYGFAKASKKEKAKWEHFIKEYLFQRQNLMYVFVLIDSRLPAQAIDLELMGMLGSRGIPFVMVYTKIDKLSSSALQKNIAAYKKQMLKTWEELPPMVYTSSFAKQGREEVLQIIADTNKIFQEHNFSS